VQRWRAAKKAGLETVPVTVRKPRTDDEIDELRIIENLVSRTVTPYEYALNIARLIRITKTDDEFTESIIGTAGWRDGEWRLMLKLLWERSRKRKLQ